MKTLKLLAITIILIIVSINVFSNTIVVTTSTDSIVGSLRDAINKAQSGDTITFDKSLSEINLGWQINIGKSITISGNPGLLIHDNRWINSPEMNTTAVHRLFEICGSEVVVVNIYNLKLAKNREMVGDTVSYNTNGKIILISNNKAIVNLNLCHFLTGSRVSWGNIHPHYSPNGGILLFNGQNGGAIAQQGGKLTISNSTFSDLDAGGEIYWGAGGAICQFAGELNIFNCTFYQNSIDHSILFIGKGSAIYSQNSILSITNCSFCRQTNYYSYFLPPTQILT